MRSRTLAFQLPVNASWSDQSAISNGESGFLDSLQGVSELFVMVEVKADERSFHCHYPVASQVSLSFDL